MSRNEPVTTPTGLSRMWAVLRDALRGAEADYTRGSISRPIFLLAIPMVLEMVLQSAFMLVDSLFVSRLGSEAMAVVGLTSVVFALLLTLAHGLGEATTAMVARRTGEKELRAAAQAAIHALVMGSLIAIVLGVAGVLAAGRILSLMGASPSVASAGFTYMAISLGCSITVFFVIVANGVLRGAGDAALTLRSLWLANGLNVLLDPILIFGIGPIPALGLTGAAIASVTGWGIAGLYQVWILSTGRGRLAIRHADLKFDRAVASSLLKVAFPATLDHQLGTAAYLLLYRIIALFGSPALAAFTICTRIFLLADSTSGGFANAAGSLVGQNLGAGRARRAERTAWRVAFYNMLMQGTIGVLYMIFAEPLMRVFSSDPEVIGIGKSCLLWVSAGYALYGCGSVISQSFYGAGDTTTPTVINAGAMWLCQIPLAWLLGVTLAFGARGVFIALLVSESLLALVTIIVFRRGRWQEKKI